MNDEHTKSPLTQSSQLSSRRAYARPALVVYGTIRALTNQSGFNRNKDGGNNAQGNRT